MNYFLMLLIILLSIMKISFSYANPLGNTTLDCKMIRYDIGNELETYTNYGLSTVKSFIPSNYILHFTTKGNRYKKYEIEVTKNTQDKIYFQYYTKDKSYMHDYLSFRPWKHVYFKKNNVLNVYFDMFEETLNIWGQCIRKTVKTLTISKPKINQKLKTISNSNKKTNKISNKTLDAEDKCAEIGFKKGTEKYGECVLKMIEF
jgi:hypothetical protein